MIIYPSKRTYFSLRKPQIRTLYTTTAQNADFMGRKTLFREASFLLAPIYFILLLRVQRC
ncbi:MAG: hypothetical protein CSA04_03745 [Bacteroidetes bacterium]|nr:MAG: hypothetical protein CSA04_03745 [Bacteroidota bacterium]